MNEIESSENVADKAAGILAYVKAFQYICADYSHSKPFSPLVKAPKGYHLIFMGPDTPECGCRNLHDKQLDWFEAELDKAAGSGKPVFVFNHYPCCVIGEGYDRYISLLNKYDNIFLIVGHAHSAPIFDTVPGEKKNSEIWVPSLTSNNDHTTGYGYLMEVYENSLTFRTYDYLTGTFTGTDMTYAIK